MFKFRYGVVIHLFVFSTILKYSEYNKTNKNKSNLNYTHPTTI